MHEGKIAEMKTGEGKTIVATLPLYLNALTGRGVHLVTVNDYLSKHQGEGMGEVYNFLGMSVGVIQSNQETYKFQKTKSFKHYSECDGSNLTPCSRKEAYACDITYGTNNEFGFDYLRDNMAPTVEACVQRELFFAIVDEVDSILIDEARTPLIISSAAEESGGLYAQFAALVPKLSEATDYTLNEKDRAVYLTDEGIKKMEKMLGVENIYEASGGTMVHHLEQALKAHALFKKDRDYVVREGEIIIVDEFTGRLMIGRRYSEGLHQAIEAKEGVEVKRESQTLATVSFQNLFRMYKKLSGMTGTAATEAEEFFKIYSLDVVEIPTNKPVVRADHEDKIYKTESGKYAAVVEDVKVCNEKGQPVLIGTVSVEKNEHVSKLLKKAGIKHEILNAKNHEREAKIIAKAGLKGAITVATNMAGRGTDIRLGEGVREVGGLHVIGTERHEARRIDNQLRGRAGRQGDPGSSQFYVSLDDDLMRIFGGERIKLMMDRLGLPDDQPIENRMISKSIESAQRKVEGYNFDTRKHLVDYDDVMNKHREVIYRKRRRILELSGSSDLTIKEEILGIVYDQLTAIVNRNIEDKEKTISEVKTIFGDIKISDLSIDGLNKLAEEIYDEREARYTPEVMRNIERAVYLRTIDTLWVEHLTTMDELREGIGLRGYGQRDPLVEYKAEAYRLFEGLIAAIESSVARVIYKVEVQVQPTAPIVRRPLEYHAPDPDTVGNTSTEELENLKTDGQGYSGAEGRGKELAVNSNRLSDGLKTDNRQPTTDNRSGVTTTIRGPKERSVHERMMESAGKQHTIKSTKKVGRNDPCPCGSGKKYKKCCGR
ncbi:MAG: preprotein translocase subunit SecA [Chloroflexi bacterium ADurb.Bin344]|nr:MAG: preprotein translocase subunit SecA [Chloroflexi bacterium ADurb.Bin344]